MRGFIFRYRGWIFLALLFPWFFVGGPGSESSRLFEESWNLGHVLFFAVFTFEVDRFFLQNHWRVRARYALTLLLVATLAFGIELVQTFVAGRESSLQDIFLGLAGGCAVLLWKGSEQIKGGGKIALRGCGLVVIVMSLLPLLLVTFDEYRAWRDFPVLSDFESALDLSRWEGKAEIARVRQPVKNGKFALKVSLTTEKYSGIALRHFPENWRAARALTFSVFNPGETLALQYRVHDWQHRGKDQDYANRFNGQAVLASGWNTITVPMKEIENGPKNRQMDLAHIRGLGFFVVEQPSERILYFDDVRLLGSIGD